MTEYQRQAARIASLVELRLSKWNHAKPAQEAKKYTEADKMFDAMVASYRKRQARGMA
jgi:hypothetical protein